jgi:hypothetical protein
MGPTAWKPFLFVAIIFAKPEESHAAAGPGITLDVDPDALWMNNMPIAMGGSREDNLLSPDSGSGDEEAPSTPPSPSRPPSLPPPPPPSPSPAAPPQSPHLLPPSSPPPAEKKPTEAPSEEQPEEMEEDPARAARAQELKEKMDALKEAKDAGDITIVEYAQAISKLRHEHQAAEQAAAAARKREVLQEYETVIGGTFTSPSLQAPAAATEKPTPSEKPTEAPTEETQLQETPEEVEASPPPSLPSPSPSPPPQPPPPPPPSPPPPAEKKRTEAPAEEAEELAKEEAPAMAPAAAVKPPLLVATDHPQVLVLVSDHASGTTEFGRALQTHPCVFDLEEPFSFSSMVWSTTKVHGCNASSFADAIFDADTGTILKKANPVLSEKILGLSDTKKPGFQPSGLTGDDPSLYEGLSYDFAEYVVRIRDLVCKGVPANVCPPSDCTITLKFFPQFVNANTAGQLVKERPPTKCVKDRNDKTMVAWVHALKTMAENKKVAMMAIMRNESDRQFSTFHQFAPAGTQFDCSLRREPTTFSVMSRKYTDGLINIEDCWTGPGGAGKCLRDALELVGLSAEPMGDMGTRVMAGSSLDWAAHGNAAAPATAPVLAPVPAASMAGPAQLEFNAMAPALAGAAVAAPLPAFMASSEGFKGFRKGYHFGLGAEGLGYYINSAPVTHMAAPLGFPMRHEPLGYPTRHEPQPLPLQRAHQVVSFTQVGQLTMEQMLPKLPASLPLPPTTTREAWAAWAATPVSLRVLPAEHPDKYEYAKARSSCATDTGAMFLSKGNGVVEKADPAPPPTSPAPLPLLSPSASLSPGKAGAKKASAAEKAAVEKAAVEKAAAEKAAAEKAAAEKAAAEKAAAEKAAAEKAAAEKVAAEKAAAEKAAAEKAAAEKAEAKRKKLEQLEEYKTAIGGTFTSPSLQAPAAATEKPTPAEKPTEASAEEKVQEKPEGSEEFAKESAAEEELAAAEEEPAAAEEEPAAKEEEPAAKEEEPAKAARAKESKENMDADMAALKAAKDAGDITVVEYAEAIAKLKEKTAAAEKAAVEQAAAKKAADEKAAAQKAEEKAKAEEEKAKAEAEAEAEAKEEKETAEREIRIAAEKAEAEKAAAEKAAVSSEEPVKEPAEPEAEEPAAKEEPAKAAQAKESKEKMDAEMAALKAAKDAGDITVVEYAEAIAKLRQEQQVAEQAAAAAASGGQDPPDRKRKPAEAEGKYSSQGEEERGEPLGEPAALQPAVITSQVQLERRIDDLEHEIAAALRVDELEHNSEEAQLLMAGRAEVAKKEALFASQLPWSKNARKRKARRKALR